MSSELSNPSIIYGTAEIDPEHIAEIAQAFDTRLTAVTPHYARVPIQDGFNWAETFKGTTSGEWYLVVFRSQHSVHADKDLLTERDYFAHEAARATPGYIYYFGGMPTEDRFCLSFCLWTNQIQARLGAKHEPHKSAAELAPASYDMFHLERYVVRHENGTVQFTRVTGEPHPAH